MNRRSFLQGTLLAASALAAPSISRRKLAAIVSSYRLRSDADNIVTRFLEGYWINDDFYPPPCDIASLYVAKTHPADISSRLAAAYQIPLIHSIPDALTAADGVLLISEDDPFDLFQQMVSAFKRPVPVFCAGYLSPNWDHARQMVQQSHDLGFPLMAGCSEACTFRRPELDYPLPSGFDDAPLGDRAHHDYKLGVEFEHALVITPNIFAGLEILQSFLERRRGGETGISSVELLADHALSSELMDAALSRATSPPQILRNSCLIRYYDGTQAAILSQGTLESVAAFHVTGRREIDSTLCYTPIESRNDFSLLVHGISQMMITGTPPYPIERNLLTTGALSFLRESERQHKPIETPSLRIAYTAPEQSFYARGRGW